jgi:hypothetical protein
MQDAGLDLAASAAAIAEVERDPLLAAARRAQQLCRKLEAVVGNPRRLWELDPHFPEVERIAEPEPAVFVERCVRGCHRVVLTCVSRDWPAMQRWSPADLTARIAHHEVEVQPERQDDPRYEEIKLEHRRRVRLADFVDRVVGGGMIDDDSLTADNEVLCRPEFAPLLDDIGALLRVCDRAPPARGRRSGSARPER